MKVAFLLILFFFGQGKSAQAAELVLLATFEAPPFFSSKMPDDGAAAYGIKQIFQSLGYKIEYRYYPVRRARQEIQKDNQLIGYTPCSEYDVTPELILSEMVYYTTTVLIERKNNPIPWKTPKDLAPFRGSHVRGYALKGQMQKAFAKGYIKIEDAPDDASGILKVANGRSDYHFINSSIYQYLSEHDPRVKKVTPLLQISPKPIAKVGWGVCFKKNSPQAAKILKAFNRSPRQQEFTETVTNYLKNVKK